MAVTVAKRSKALRTVDYISRSVIYHSCFKYADKAQLYNYQQLTMQQNFCWLFAISHIEMPTDNLLCVSQCNVTQSQFYFYSVCTPCITIRIVAEISAASALTQDRFTRNTPQ
jgi:hypothetical protein